MPDIIENKLIDAIVSLDKQDKNLILEAIVFAKEHHKNQLRKSGEPYVIHLLEVAYDLFERYKDPVLTASGLLHDTVEDCESVCIKDIYDKFGKEVGFLVDAVTKDSLTFYDFPKMKFEEKTERLIWAGMKDVRCFLLKIADRENNLKTLSNLKEHKQVRMAFETQAVFQPLKKILRLNGKISVEEIQEIFDQFAKKENLKTPNEIKEKLLQDSFENIDNEMFGLVYKNSNTIIWKIDDINMYKKMCENKNLNGKINFLSVAGNANWFEASFQFKEGAVLGEDVKFSISSFRS